jgi:hypothetical protein
LTSSFFLPLGTQSTQSTSDQFHFRRAVFLQQLKGKVGLTLAKTAALRINLNLDGAPITGYVRGHGYQVIREKLHSS